MQASAALHYNEGAKEPKLKQNLLSTMIDKLQQILGHYT
jgi:hypothetical protein